MKQKVKLGLAGLKTSDLIAKCISIEEKINNNPRFPNPVPALANLTAAREDLEQKAVASRFGDRQAIAERRSQHAVLKDMLTRLASYVQLMSGNAEDVLSAGYEVYRKATPGGPLGRPAGLEARRSDHQGKVDLKWSSVKGGMNYLIEFSTEDPGLVSNAWVQAGFTTRSRFTVEALTPGKVYWFRVLALGSSGQSAWSDPAMVMAA